jgi:hypothetical protein
MKPNNQINATAQAVEVNTDSVIAKDLRITGQPAQKIIEGTLQGVEPLITLTKMLDLGAIALDSVQCETMHHHLEVATENFAKLVNKEASETFPRLIEEKTTKFVEGILKYLDPEQTNSLNSQLSAQMKSFKKEIISQISEDMKQQKTSLDEGLKNLGFLKKAFDQSSHKGISHQDYVGEVLERFAGTDVVSDLSSDSAGSSYAAGRSKSGDYRVTLGETFGTTNVISFSVEAKNTKLSEKMALKELSENCKNRGTDVGILVFANHDQAPTQGRSLKIFPGNKIIVVCDNESETALYAACIYARSMSKLLQSSTEFDGSTLSQAIEEAIKHLDIEDQINKDAKSARNAIDRMVTTAISARTNVLKVLNQFEDKGRQ